MKVVPDQHYVEIVVTQNTVESLWFLAEAWQCSVDDALDRCVEAGIAKESDE